MYHFSFYIFLLFLTISNFKPLIVLSEMYPKSEKNYVISPENKTDIRDEIDRHTVGRIYVEDISLYPYMAYVYRAMSTEGLLRETYKCAATILGNSFVLTAAHCVMTCYCGYIQDDECLKCYTADVATLTVYAGSAIPGNATAKSGVHRFFIHPKYKQNNLKLNCYRRFDLAVLELTSPLEFNDKISPVILPQYVELESYNFSKSPTEELINGHEVCTFLGWGDDVYSPSDNQKYLNEQLKAITIPLVTLEECSDKIGHHDRFDGRTMICRKTSLCTFPAANNISMCYGDHGGPLICKGVQVGVLSWTWGSNYCTGNNLPVVYSRIDVAYDWIVKVLY